VFILQSTEYILEYSGPLQYNGSSISTMSIPLMLTVLVRILEAALLCCRLALMNEMILTMSCSASSSSSFSSSPLPISSLLVWHTEGRRWPVLLHWRVSNPFPPVQRQMSCQCWAQGRPHWVPPCTHRLFFGWCQVPGLAYETTGNTALHPPKGPETGHHSFIGEKSIPAHHLVPRALPSYKGWLP